MYLQITGSKPFNLRTPPQLCGSVRFGEIIIMHKVIEHYGLYSESSQQQILSVDEGLLYWKLIAARISGKQIP